jgi:multicomponent Na+:H+ antiporter subunit D
MTQQLLISPILFQFLLTILLIFFWRRVSVQRALSIGGGLIQLGIAIALFRRVWNSGIITLQAGNWPAPFGITLVADTLAATLVLLTAIAGLAAAVFASGTVHSPRLRFGYFPVYHFLLLGLNGAFLTGDIFNLYVWFEIIIISSFVLITLGGEKRQLEGAVKYFTLNILASVFFLTAIGVLYGLTGTLNLADLALKAQALENRGLVMVCGLIFFVGFGIKSAVFPLYFWLPASYHTPQAAVGAIFAGLLTKVGVYAMLRVFTLIFTGHEFIGQVMALVAMLTLFSGGVGALVQNNIRKIFSYLIICHIGYMIAGLAMFTTLAISGAVFYLVHDIVVKTNLFMAAGLIHRIKGSNSMRNLGGLYAEYPRLSLLMAIPLFSLVGIPPLSGFWPKLSLVLAGLEQERYLLVGFILFASFITLFIIARFWAEVFWKTGDSLPNRPKFVYFASLSSSRKAAMVAPIVALAAVSLYIGFGAEHIQVLSQRVAAELMNPSAYIECVLNHVQTLTE